MFGSLGDLGGLMKQAREFQSKLQAMQEELRGQQFEAQSGGGMVRVTVNGKGEIAAIKIDPDAVSDVEMLEDLVKSAINAANARAQESMKEEMAKLTGGMNIPGLTEMMGGAGK